MRRVCSGHSAAIERLHGLLQVYVPRSTTNLTRPDPDPLLTAHKVQTVRTRFVQDRSFARRLGPVIMYPIVAQLPL